MVRDQGLEMPSQFEGKFSILVCWILEFVLLNILILIVRKGMK